MFKYSIAAVLLASVEGHRVRHHHKHQKHSGYEPGWGHNSGDSYNNGPTTHFAYGKASPYDVTGDDGLEVQLKAETAIRNHQRYETEWGHNSGNSYNNGPFTHFAFGKASPYDVTGDDGLEVQLKAETAIANHQRYETEWGHNSGNSYNNGPFTHFAFGKASPYDVTGDDGLEVQLASKVNTGSKYETEWGHNSGNSYNNGPFTHFAFGKASPYDVTGDDGLE